MNHTIGRQLTAVLLAFAAWGCPAATPALADSDLLGARWLVVWKRQPQARMALARDDVLAPARQMGAQVRALGGDTDRLTLSPQLAPAQRHALLQQLRADPRVAQLEPDVRMRRHVALPNDPGYGPSRYVSAQPVGQWHLKANAGEVRAAIDAEGAWPYSQGLSTVVVAVLDSGVRFDHPDLLPVAAAGRLLPGYDFVSGESEGGFVLPNDGDDWDADASDPGDWIDDALRGAHPALLQDCAVETSSWHGTRVAGLIGALSNNALGVAGVDWNARVLPVRVLGRCGGYTSDIVAGIRWAAGVALEGVPANPNPAKVINLSLGHEGACTFAEQSAIDEALARGVVVVASAGNGMGAVHAPGNCRGVVAVAGLRHAGTKVGFSSFGPEVAIAAPGGNCVNIGDGEPCLYSIDTLTNTGSGAPAENTVTTQLDSNVGTSFSAPLVSGVAALLLAVDPSLTVAQVRAALQASATPFPVDPTLPQCPELAQGELGSGQCSCNTNQCGAGMLNARAAVQQVNRADCLFDWAQRTAPELFMPGALTQTVDVYQFRYYPQTASYLAIAGDSGHLLFLIEPEPVRDLGSRSTWFAQAGCR